VIVNYQLLAGQIKKELDEQFDTGRIRGTEYADVFNKLMAQAMQHAFESPIKDEQIAQTQSQTALIDAQRTDQEYVTNYIRPQEKSKIQCEIDLCEAQIELTTAQASDQRYVTQHIRPTEAQIKERELEIAEAKVQIAIKEVGIKEQELRIKMVELDIAKERLELARQDAALKEVQVRLTERQILGFDDNKKQKMLDTQMNAWGMMFSSGLLNQVPSVINGCWVDSLYTAMSNEVGITPSGSCATPTSRKK